MKPTPKPPLRLSEVLLKWHLQFLAAPPSWKKKIVDQEKNKDDIPPVKK